MKRIPILIVLLAVGFTTLKAQTLSIVNESGIGLSAVVFTLRSGEAKRVAFYGKKIVVVPEGSVKFEIVTAPVYRNNQTNKYTMEIGTHPLPIMSFGDLEFLVTLDGSMHDAQNSELCVEEIEVESY